MASKIVIDLDTAREQHIVRGCKQNDGLTLEAYIYEDGVAKELTTTEIAINCTRSDGKYTILNGQNVQKANNKITATLNEEFTKVPGEAKVDITMTDNARQNTTFDFILDVKALAIEGAVQSDNTVTIIQELQDAITSAGQKSTEITTATQQAEAKRQELITATSDGEKQRVAVVEATTNANQATTNANNAKTNADNARTQLEGVINTANQSKTDLDASNTTATNTKQGLDTSNQTATATKQGLDQSNTTAQQRKQELDQSIANAQNVMGGGAIVEDFGGASITPTDTKARIKVGNAYKLPVTISDAVYLANGNRNLSNWINEWEGKVNNKVDTVSGKQLSTNDYTAEDKATVGQARTLMASGGTIGGQTTVAGNLISDATIMADRIQGRAINSDQTLDRITIGSGTNRIDTTGGAFRLWNTPLGTINTGLEISANGTVGFFTNSTQTHTFGNNGNLDITGALGVGGNATVGNNLVANGNITTGRLKGNSPNEYNIYLGSDVNNTRIDTTSGIMRLFTSGVGVGVDNGILIGTDGNVSIKCNGVEKHGFRADGSKVAGTMEIDGTVYGMSPTDSPQTLIEYIIPNVKVEKELKLQLDKIYIKMVEYYVAFLSNKNIDIKEKGADYIVLTGNGQTDILIKGQRKGADDYFRIMGGLEHGVSKEESM